LRIAYTDTVRNKKGYIMNVQAAHEAALEAAKAAGDAWLAKYGDRDACGFAWVNFYVDGRTKAGRELKKIEGVRRSWEGGLQLWNPATKVGIYVQSVGALGAAAQGYAAKFRELTGIKEVYAGSRLD